jgi:hypothetical protein
MADPKVGDTVGFAKPFLRSIHASATDPIWFERGTVESIREYGKGIPAIALVRGFQTSSEDGLAHVNIKNIAVVGSFRFAEAEK